MKVFSSYWLIPIGLFFSAILFVSTIFITNRFEAQDQICEFILYKNEPVRTTAQRLKEAGIIENPIKFIFLAKLLNYEHSLKTGKYNLSKGLDELSALKRLGQGGKVSTLVTIPEGKTLQQVAEILAEQGICAKEDFLKQAKDQNFLLEFGIKAKSAEGYLFPDSYEFEIQASPKEVLARMIKRFFTVYNSLSPDQSNLPRLGFSLHEIVTLASIVEAEAQKNSERPIIAQVFLSRLKRRLPLQSCATVEYILKERKSRLSLKDLSIESPYNTYLHPGLPPGPIGNPGRNSLLAVLFPAKTDYLFFVSRGDGSHHFSKTSKEHQIATQRYQKNFSK